MQVMMPVGYVFQWAPVEGDGLDLSTADKVRAYFGFGTWEAVSSGRALMGADDAHAAGSTAEAGLPAITGDTIVQSDSNVSYGYTGAFTGKSSVSGAFAASSKFSTLNGGSDYTIKIYSGTFKASRCSSIYGASDTVQPPSYYVYIWKRIA